jgi:uncharacterized membrane protein YccC
MSSTGYSFRTHVMESLTAIKRPDVPVRVVVRNTAAVILPLAVGLACGYPQIGLGVAAGALNTMFSDQPGPYRQRMGQLLLASLAAALASLLGFLIGGSLLPVLLATMLFGFFGGLLVVFGADTARVGMTSMILLVITASTPTTLIDALEGAALIFSGGILLTMFSLAAWPLQRYWPERTALATVYAGLAVLAREQSREDEAPALTEAMNALQQTLLGRHRAQGRAMEAFGVLLELAERIRLELIATNELRTNPTIHAIFRDDAARVLAAIANALEQGDSPRRAALALEDLRASEHALPVDDHRGEGLSSHIHALIGQLAAAVRNADWAGSRGELRASEAETTIPKPLRGRSIIATLRANLTPHSVAFRHALRMAICLSLALWISRLLQLPHGYWLPMTAAIVLRADFAATFQFGVLRVLGTVLGLVLTTVLLHITPNEPWAHLALMALLCMGFRYLATAHYGIAVAALTGTVVILLSFEGVESGAAVIDRVINTVFGCGMALLAYVAWPTWERVHTRSALADMLDAYASYLKALALPDGATSPDHARTAARRARTNAQASIERMRSEPGTPPELLALARALLSNGNRLARTSMTLEAVRSDLASLPAQQQITRFIIDAADALGIIAAALRRQEIPQSLPDLRSRQRQLKNATQEAKDRLGAELLGRLSDRLVDNVNTLAYVMTRQRTEPDTATPVPAP